MQGSALPWDTVACARGANDDIGDDTRPPNDRASRLECDADSADGGCSRPDGVELLLPACLKLELPWEQSLLQKRFARRKTQDARL